MKIKTKAYMAGILDAEGCLSITKQKQYATPNSFNYGVVVDVANDSQNLLKWVVSNFGGSYRKNGTGYKWALFDQANISSFLALVYPFLFVKKSQADLLMEFISLGRGRNVAAREELFLKCRLAKEQECVTTNSSGILSRKVLRPYLAGLFDGEGSAILGRQKRGCFYTRASFENSFQAVVEFFKYMYGGEVKPSKKVNLQCYKWYIDRKENKEKFLLQMIPYLIVKREKAKLVLEYLRLGSGLGETSLKRAELFRRSEQMKIESDLYGDVQSGPVVTQEG